MLHTCGKRTYQQADVAGRAGEKGEVGLLQSCSQHSAASGNLPTRACPRACRTPPPASTVQLDERSDTDAIQDALQEVTGARSVPRVFVGGQFIGGGDDTARKVSDGTLKQLLHDVGAL